MKGAIVILALASVVLADPNIYVPRHHSTRHHGYDSRFTPEVYRHSPEVYKYSPEVYKYSPEVYKYSPEVTRSSGYPKVYEVFPKESEAYSRPEETEVTVEKRPKTENTVDVDVVLRKPNTIYRRKDQQGSYVVVPTTTYEQKKYGQTIRTPEGQTIRIPYGVPTTVYGEPRTVYEPRTTYGQYEPRTTYGQYEPRTTYGQYDPRTVYEPRTTYGQNTVYEPTSYGVPIRTPYGQRNVYYGEQRTPSVYERVGNHEYIVSSPYSQYPYVSSPVLRRPHHLGSVFSG